MRNTGRVLVAVAALAFLAAGCGSSQGGDGVARSYVDCRAPTPKQSSCWVQQTQYGGSLIVPYVGPHAKVMWTYTPPHGMDRRAVATGADGLLRAFGHERERDGSVRGRLAPQASVLAVEDRRGHRRPSWQRRRPGMVHGR